MTKLHSMIMGFINGMLGGVPLAMSKRRAIEDLKLRSERLRADLAEYLKHSEEDALRRDLEVISADLHAAIQKTIEEAEEWTPEQPRERKTTRPPTSQHRTPVMT